MKAYEFDGEKYKKASGHQKEWGNSLIAQIPFAGNEHILDLGCGDGVLTERLAKLVPNGEVLGIDASIGMIQTAKAIEKDNLRFVQMDINTMNFEAEFDIIYSNAALHWVKDHPLLLKNAFRALKQGGYIYWNFAGDGTCQAFNNLMKEIITESEYQIYFQDFEWPWVMLSEAEYKHLVKTAGFSDIEITMENRDMYFKNTLELIQWIDQPSIVPFLSSLPEEKKKGFRENVIDKMVDKTRQPDGTCFETFRRINIHAQKPRDSRA